MIAPLVAPSIVSVSPAKKPPVTDTVAPESVALLGSAAVSPLSMTVAAPPCV